MNEVFKNNIIINDKHSAQNKNVDKSMCCDDLYDLSKTKFINKPNKAPQLFAAVVGEDNTAVPFSSEGYDKVWTDFDATELYLKSKPTTYLILSKPGVNAFLLGEEISKKYKCIHLCPQLIVEDELNQRGPTGDCLDYNMRHNNICRFDLLLKMMKKKISSAVVKHRGFVISGFPMIHSNRKDLYWFQSFNGEESREVLEQILDDILKEAVKPRKNSKKKSKKPRVEDKELGEFGEESFSDVEELPEDAEEEEQLEDEADIPLDVPRFILDACSDIISAQEPYYDSNKASMVKQYYEILNLEVKLDVIIYISCSDADVLKLKQQKHMSYLNETVVAKKELNSDTNTESRWPKKYLTEDYTKVLEDVDNKDKYFCRQPLNWEENAINQLCNFNEHIVPFIDKHIQGFNPKFLIRVDGRCSVNEMLHNITKRLQDLPIQPVYLAEPLVLEDLPDELEEFWKALDEEIATRSGILSFTRYPSPWLNRCPVMLKRRKSVIGDTKLAVSFLKHAYLMSSFDCLVEFCKNPRSYLKLAYLEPTCRIFVTGTKLSGKTMVAKCLSWIFEAPVIDYSVFLERERKAKYNIYSARILSEIIATIEDSRLLKWEKDELERLTKLDAWYNTTLQSLKKYVPLFEKLLEIQETPDQIFINNIEDIKSKLQFLDFLDDISQCKKALFSKNILLRHAPKQMITVTPKPGVPTLGDADVTAAIAEYVKNNELQDEIEPTTEELMKQFIKIINSYDYDILENNKVQTKFGKWVVDGFPCSAEVWSVLTDLNGLPDNTIALIENRDFDYELTRHYQEIAKATKFYDERFITAKDPLVKIKLQTKKPPEENKLQSISAMLNDVINNIFEAMSPYEEDISAEDSPDLSSETNRIRDDWDSIKVSLEENKKCFIEVELEGKSDIETIEEALLKLRKTYYLAPRELDLEEGGEGEEEERDLLVYNSPGYLGDTGVYDPVLYYERGVLWQGKSMFATKYDNKVIFFSTSENMTQYYENPIKYQQYNKPFRPIPSLRICVVGCVGSGKTSVSKNLAKELGLIHVDFLEFINNYVIPKNYRKVGRQYENNFNEEEIDEEGMSPVEINEEASEAILSEAEMRNMFTNYFERGSPIYPAILKTILETLWFNEPYHSVGIVLDGFPRMPTDVEEMIAYYCIPDLVIEIDSTADNAVERLASVMFDAWKLQLAEAKQISKAKFHVQKQKWLDLITKIIVPKSVYEDLIDNVFVNVPHHEEGVEEGTRLSNYDSTIIDADPTGVTNTLNPHVYNIYNQVIDEYPSPEYTATWDDPEEVRVKIEERLGSIHEIEDENIQSMKELLSENKMYSTVIQNKNINLNKLLRTVLMKLKEFHSLSRNESFFEMTYIVQYDVSELLLAMGFFYFSNFYRMCPVYIYENPQCIRNPFDTYKRNNDLYCVLHRSCLYFIFSKESVIKFRTDPLKYVYGHTINTFIEYPLSVCVIGPPKSGKSAVTAKFAQLGLMPVSKGAAIRHVLDHMPWSELALKMDVQLRAGECVDVDLITQAMKIVVFDHRTYSYGFVFDGYPETVLEAYQLSKEGLYPMFVIDLQCSQSKVMKNTQNEVYVDIQKYIAPYSTAFIEVRFMKWAENMPGIRKFINDDYQNIYEVDAEGSQWSCVDSACNAVIDKVPKIHYYLTNVKKTVVPVDIMCISNEIFEQRMSSYKNFCPLCFRKNQLRQSNFPVDRKGVVQYKNEFYWICAEHMGDVLSMPELHLVPRKVIFPEVATPVTHIDINNVYENGICIVTYAINLPGQRIRSGSNQYAASFKGRFYLFCTDKCREKFLEQPHLYCDISIFKHRKVLPELSLKSLPHLGYLEQTLGNIITGACCYVNVLRPKYPGLDPALSGILLIALYLKIHNPLTASTYKTLYEKTNKIYEARAKIVIDVGLYLRSMDNPFAKYPVYTRKRIHSHSVQKVTSPVTTRSSSLGNENVGAECIYHESENLLNEMRE